VVLDAAVRKLKLYEDPEFNEGDKQDEAGRIDNAVLALQKKLTISGVRSTQLVSVSVEAKSAQKAADIANGVAQALLITVCSRRKTPCFRRKARTKK
jgi:uncharacterized protein involved in exopolysaccharide biosynthesis